ncbi:MAG: response regulator transcription factor [Zoogloeaceae bacterium]|nr:response regulator transcription factor [Zoogloeaceae bacterium]
MASCSPPRPDPLKVLLVEDSPLLREMMAEMLEELPEIRLVEEVDGEARALACLEAQPVDLAIVDLELKEGSGFGILRQLQARPEHYGHPRAVVFSSYSHAAVRQRCAALGAEAFFDKAQGLEALVDFVQSAAQSASGP